MIFENKPSRTPLAAIAGILLSVIQVHADPVPNPASGDLFLGFRAVGEEGLPGGSESYIVKLGKDTDSAFAASGTIASVGNIGADLVAKYGSNWASRSDLYWGIFGVRGLSTFATVYASRERNPVGTPATPWAQLNLAERTSAGNRISSVLNGIGGYRSRLATANSPVGTFQENAAQDSSYNYQVATPGTSDFGSLSQWQSIEGTFGSGVAGTALDVFRLSGDGSTPSFPTTLFGTFTITGGGVIQFTRPTAVPVDSDGDGVLDSDEAIAGTNPADASDFFRVQSVAPSASGVAIGFNSVASRTYRIYYSQDLSSSSWELIATVSSGPFTDNDPVRKARPQGFYKVSVSAQ